MNLLRVSFTAGSHKTFRHILRNTTVSSNINTMIRRFATTTSGNSEPEQVVEQMKNPTPTVDWVTYNNTLINDMSKAEETYTSQIDSLCKQDMIFEAFKVMTEMIATGFSPSDDTLNNVHRGFIRIGYMRHAYDMFMQVRMDGEQYGWWMSEETKSCFYQNLSDEVTYIGLMNAYLDEGNWDYANYLYYKMLNFGSLSDSVLYSVFINGLDNKARTTEIKRDLLRFNYEKFLDWPILEYRRTLVEKSSDDEFKSVVEVVDGICVKGLENVFDILLKSNYKPNGIDDGIVYNLLIIAHCKHNNFDEAYIMYKEMGHYGFNCHMFTVLVLIETLRRGDMVDELRCVVHSLLMSCNLNDSKICKFLYELDPEDESFSDDFFDVLAENAKDGLFLKCLYAPPSA